MMPAVARESSERIAHAIFDHAARISRAQDLREMIRLNADFARDLTGAERCSLWLVDLKANELWTIVSHGVDAIRIPLDKGLAGACARDGEVIIVNNVASDPRFLNKVDQSSGFRTEQILCVPMRAEGKVIGVLQLLNKRGGFSEPDASLVGLLAHFAASAIETERLREDAETARLFKHELDLARDVQARLLPQNIGAADGLSIACFFRPAKLVGGDYYDVIPIHDGRLAFTLGDVSGKGIAAAVMMASIQTLLRGLLRRDALKVAVGELNRALHASSTADRYTTLFCAMLDESRRTLTYVNGGHVQPLLLRASGELLELPGGGLPVGLMPMSRYEEMTIAVGPGDTLLVVSDGFMEVSNPNDEFWEESKLGELLKAHGGKPTSELPAALCAEADAWANGAEQHDDMTMVAIRIEN